MAREEIQELKDKVAKLEREVTKLEKDMIHDPLTGLRTRKFFEEELSVYLNTLGKNILDKRRESFGFTNLSIIFFDIDHFKKVNDIYGHDSGDIVLKKISEIIRLSTRAGDTAARWGGEEIIVSLLGAGEKDAVAKAEEIRSNVEKFVFEGIQDLKLTVSAGVASVEKDITVKELMKNADKALYRAKSLGRNKVVTYSEINK